MRIEGEQDWRAVADGGSGGEIPAERGAVTNLARSEASQHIVEHWNFAGKLFLNLAERSGSADVPGGLVKVYLL